MDKFICIKCGKDIRECGLQTVQRGVDIYDSFTYRNGTFEVDDDTDYQGIIEIVYQCLNCGKEINDELSDEIQDIISW